MKKQLNKWQYIVLTYLLTIFSTFVFAQKNKTFESDGRSVNVAEFDREMISMMEELNISGASVAIIDDKSIAYAKSYGIKSKSEEKKVRKNTIFEACSLSKSFLVVVAHQMVDEGLLDLDKPMYQYLDPGASLNHDPRYKEITAKMILSHSSGLENWPSDNNPEVLEIVSNPGEKFVYSGIGYNYLGATMEGLLGASYDDFVIERVVGPLKLKRTYLRYRENKLSFKNGAFGNYATGHDYFGNEIEKWKNDTGSPASGVHLTAHDYAALILGLDQKLNLSGERKKDLLTPMISMNEEVGKLFYGPGFEVCIAQGDTILAQGGDNPGFKGRLFYSTVQKKGVVFFANSDLGISMSKRINDLTARLDLDTYFNEFPIPQYPSASLSLLEIYNQSGSTSLLSKVDELLKKETLSVKNLDELTQLFFDANPELTIELLNRRLTEKSSDSFSHYLLGKLNMKMEHYQVAHENFLKASELGSLEQGLVAAIETCEKKLKGDFAPKEEILKEG